MAESYEFTFNGVSPLLMHRDDIDRSTELDEWRKDPANKTISKKGDDRSPAWTWISYIYASEGKLAMPSDNIMTALRDAGKQIDLPGGKNGKTLKSATQYGIITTAEAFDFLVKGKPVSTAKIYDLWEDNDFPKHEKLAESLGFLLHKKRCKPKGASGKHIRVRPIFEAWSVKGSMTVTEPAITQPILTKLLDIAGDRCGLGDWRPSSQTPGPYGRFKAAIKRIA